MLKYIGSNYFGFWFSKVSKAPEKVISPVSTSHTHNLNLSPARLPTSKSLLVSSMLFLTLLFQFMILATHTSRVSSFLPTIATASRTANRAAHRSIYQKTVFNSVEGAQTAKLHDEAKEPQEETVPSEPMPPRLMRKGTDLEATSGEIRTYI